MPWNFDDAQINGIIDSNIKDSPPAAPASNTASVVRTMLKALWVAMRTQIAAAVASIDLTYNTLVARSLNMNAIVHLDGTNGNDANTGASGSPIKTLGKLAALHSGKTSNIIVYLSGTLDVTENVFITANSIMFQFLVNGKMTFKKIASNNGNYTLSLDVFAAQFVTQSAGSGIMEAEGHGGNVTAEATSTYLARQGAVRLVKNTANWWRSSCKLQCVEANTMTINVGDNAVMFAGSEGGAQSNDNTKSSYFFSGTNGFFVTLGANAQLAAGFDGRRVFMRSYTPTSSTDANVLEGETVHDNNFQYKKQGGVIKKIAYVSF